MAAIWKNLGITFVANAMQTGMLACPCRDAKHLAKASEVQNILGLWQVKPLSPLMPCIGERKDPASAAF